MKALFRNYYQITTLANNSYLFYSKTYSRQSYENVEPEKSFSTHVTNLLPTTWTCITT